MTDEHVSKTQEKPMFPDDQEFEEHKITGVTAYDGGWEIKHDGLCFGVSKDSPVTPVEGMTARFYGKGFGYRVRGLFLDGAKVFYRTEAEDKEHHEIEMYGADATEWLKRWDEGRTVWTISMGGLGPGYEQCIHITCAEILRVMLEKRYDVEKWADKDEWSKVRDEIDETVMAVPCVKALGLSGAQWGAAMNVAAFLYRHGPRFVMNDERVKDRHIQVSNNFPVAA
jgi:hypothetical protein